MYGRYKRINAIIRGRRPHGGRGNTRHKEGQMPSCASEMSPWTGPAADTPISGTSATGPAAAPPPSPRAGFPRGERRPPGAARRRRSPPGPGTEPSEPPFPHSPCGGEGRAEPQAPPPLQVFQRRWRQRGERSRLCRRGRPRSGAEPPPGPARPGPRGGRARPAGLRSLDRQLPRLGHCRGAFPPASLAALGGKRRESYRRLGPSLGAGNPLSPSLLGTAGAPRGASRKY
ncbi:proline-rich protein 2-like [Pipra filicauda]|uniref:Proline-rich protein 2-like n=1 Tax=Pipra filicauda TaxID=649802 RepID=A0A6J2IZZ7_9PASS|nr:proline-rich protein 2-like [Pipra filicauda]